MLMPSLFQRPFNWALFTPDPANLELWDAGSLSVPEMQPLLPDDQVLCGPCDNPVLLPPASIHRLPATTLESCDPQPRRGRESATTDRMSFLETVPGWFYVDMLTYVR